MYNNSTVLIKALRKILRPLVNILLNYGVSINELTSITRELYIEVAEQNFAIPGKKQTISRLAVLTGLSRKEVLRIQKTCREEIPPKEPQKSNRAVRVITGWMDDPEFSAGDGQVKELPLTGGQGSFERLVKRFSGDVTSGAVLDELVRVGTVVLDQERGRVTLTKQGYIPDDIKEKIDIFATCSKDFLGTIKHNLECDRAHTRFQRQVAYADLSRDIAEEFREFSKEKSLLLMLELNMWLDNKVQKFPASPEEEESYRTGVGVYYFEDKDTNNEKS